MEGGPGAVFPGCFPSNLGRIMDPLRFEELVEEALAGLPEQFASQLDNVAIMIADMPSPGQLEEMEIDDPHDLLGLYEGIPLTERDAGYFGVLPDRITIFRLPIQKISRDEEEIKAQVRETVMHELGHYFGMEEDQLGRLEDEDWL